MAHRFAEIAFTPEIRAIQAEQGSRSSYASMDEGEDYNHRLGARETLFIAARDSFYLASVSATGWPYVQHRGGPAGFIKILDERRIGFADFSGNRQYVSTGNFRTDNRVALFFMDYPNRRRLKMLGRVRSVGLDEPAVLSRLEDADYPAQVERGFIIEVEAYDWNCPQHITPRFTAAEVDEQLASLGAENRRLSALLAGTPGLQQETAPTPWQQAPQTLGEGPLELVVSGIRQLTPRVRAFELRDSAGGELPAIEPGSHLRVPVHLASGAVVERRYSIASNPQRRDIYEIAVLREDRGGGGSAALHETWDIGTRLRAELGSHFGLHGDGRPALLIAGGIGITPIKSMARALVNQGTDFHLHYTGRSRAEMAYRDQLEHQLGSRLSIYSNVDGKRLDIAATLASVTDETVIYVCGPKRMLGAVIDAARDLGIARERLRMELFE